VPLSGIERILERMFRSILENILRGKNWRIRLRTLAVCNGVQMGVNFRTYKENSWECPEGLLWSAVEHTGSVQSCPIRSVFQSVFGSIQ